MYLLINMWFAEINEECHNIRCLGKLKSTPSVTSQISWKELFLARHFTSHLIVEMSGANEYIHLRGRSP